MGRARGPHLEEPTRELSIPPVLIVATPGPQQGQRFSLQREPSSVGREIGSDVHLDDPHVSRRHAIIGRHGDVLWVEDLGSRSGTFVNGVPVSGATELSPGDRVRFGAIELDVLTAPGAAAPRHPGTGDGARYDIHSQRADAISNVGRDQYVYNQLAFRIAPMRRRARRLLWLGWALIFSGLAFGIMMIASYQREIFDCISSSDFRCDVDFTGLALFPIAVLVVLIGFAIVVAAFLMRRRADQQERAL